MRKTEKAFDPAKPLSNQRWEKFCQAITSGKSCAASYKSAYEDSSQRAAESSAFDLLRNPRVQQRIKWIQDQLSEHCLITKKQRLDYAFEVLMSTCADMTPENPIVQSWKRTRKTVGRGEDAEEWETEEIKICDKMRALDIINKMLGDYAPEKIEDVTPLLPTERAGLAAIGGALDKLGIRKKES